MTVWTTYRNFIHLPVCVIENKVCIPDTFEKQSSQLDTREGSQIDFTTHNFPIVSSMDIFIKCGRTSNETINVQFGYVLKLKSIFEAMFAQ